VAGYAVASDCLATEVEWWFGLSGDAAGERHPGDTAAFSSLDRSE